LTASPSGERHGVIIPVPVKVMEKVGTYRFVLHFYDDYGDSYKDHEPKPALEVNGEWHLFGMAKSPMSGFTLLRSQRVQRSPL